jgi:hypothetical protein
MNSYSPTDVGKGWNKNIKPDKKPGNNNADKEMSTFDLYVCKDCNPKYSYCYAKYYSYSPDSYVAIAPPAAGSTYYVIVYARNGSGTFTLKATSYKCSVNNPVIAASSGAFMYSLAAGDSGTGSDIPVPTAEFVSN